MEKDTNQAAWTEQEKFAAQVKGVKINEFLAPLLGNTLCMVLIVEPESGFTWQCGSVHDKEVRISVLEHFLDLENTNDVIQENLKSAAGNA